MIDIHATETFAFKLSVDGDIFHFIDRNAAATRNSGLGWDDLIGKQPKECFPPRLAEHLLRYYRQCAQTNAAVVYETEHVLPSGYHCWSTSLIPFTGPDGRVDTLLGFCCDRTREGIARRASEAFHQDLKMAVGAIDGGFWSYEIDTGAFETSHPLAELIAGPGCRTLNLAEYASFVHAEDLATWCILNPTPDLVTIDYRIVTYDGRVRWLQSKQRVIRDEHGAARRIFALVIDITEQKVRFDELENEATLDPLTGLKNRRCFDRISVRALCHAQAASETLGLILVGLEGLKEINEHHGRRVGDTVLRKAAKRIARHMRKADTLARIGGAELAILLPGADREMGQTVAARIDLAFAKPIAAECGAVFLGVRSGLALSSPCDRTIGSVFDRAEADLGGAPQASGPPAEDALVDLLNIVTTDV